MYKYNLALIIKIIYLFYDRLLQSFIFKIIKVGLIICTLISINLFFFFEILHKKNQKKLFLALTGNRTRAICLEGKYSTSILLTLSTSKDVRIYNYLLTNNYIFLVKLL